MIDSTEIEDQRVEGDKVVTWVTTDVRQRATGAPITLLSTNITLIVEGELIEEWNAWEQLRLPGP